jgi:hypothetical protein
VLAALFEVIQQGFFGLTSDAWDPDNSGACTNWLRSTTFQE